MALVNGTAEQTNGGKKPEDDGGGMSKKGRSRKSQPEIKEKDYEKMPIENLDWEKIGKEERNRMKDWCRRREKELMDELTELQHSCVVSPVGRDRTFRRYWVFRSIAGLFVEDQEENIDATFLQAVSKKTCGSDCKAESSDDSASDGVKSSTSDKENLPSTAFQDNVLGDVKTEGPSLPSASNYEEKIIQQCVTVHEQVACRGNVPWSFFNTPEQLDRLIDSLNCRGIREGPLKQALQEQHDRLHDWIAHCDALVLSRPQEQDADSQDRKMLEVRMARFCKPPPIGINISLANICFEQNLREMFLDLEERLHVGSLGALKVTLFLFIDLS